MQELIERLDRGEVVILDGAMGTELQRRGVPMDRVAWSGAAIATHPQVIRAVHEDYVRAGADIHIANTFGAARHVLEPAGLGERVGELNRTAVALARQACEAAGDGRRLWVAGSISSFLPEDAALSALPVEVARANYREQAETLAEAGADLLILEMMMDVEHTAIAIEAADATGLPVWVGFSCRWARDGQSIVFWQQGRDVDFAASFDKAMAAGGVLAGVMHSEVETLAPALAIVLGRWSGPVSAYAHSGHFVMPDWQFVDAVSPERYLAAAEQWVAMGAQVIGGCCGIGPEHIRLLKKRLPKRVPEKSG
ncbi:MAG TPA: homocysteine S-methyltransferase family protein [Kiloniellales bacterium]